MMHGSLKTQTKKVNHAYNKPAVDTGRWLPHGNREQKTQQPRPKLRDEHSRVGRKILDLLFKVFAGII